MKKIYHFLLPMVLGLIAAPAIAQSPYCTPATSSGCSFGDQIINFSTNGGITNITNNGTACSPGNYGDYTNMVVTVDYLGSFGIAVQSGPTWSQDQTIWIDWNQDNDFDDPGEEVWSSVTWTTVMQTGTITCPIGALPGSTRMRVRCNFNAQCVSPCAQQSYGETEDYTVTILPPVQNDAGVAAIVSPTLPTCDLDSVDVEIALQCLGTANLTSCNIKWQVNAGAISTFNYTGNVAAQGGTDTITLTNANFSNGDVITIWTENPNGIGAGPDSLPNNDTISIVLSTGLAGVYQIPGDYANFSAAAAALGTFGVCDTVIMNVAAGTYNEQVELSEILGVSATSPVIFQGATGNPANVILEFDPSSNSSLNGVLRLNESDWITFRDMTIDNTSNTFSFGRTVVLENAAEHNTFDNCVIDGSPANTTSANNAVVYAYNLAGTLRWNAFNDCLIKHGSTGVYYYGGSASHNNGFSLTNSEVDSFYYAALWAYYTDSIDIVNNYFHTDKPYTFMYGNYIVDCDKHLNYTHNTLHQGDVGIMYYGLYVANCDGTLNNRLNFSNNCINVGFEGSTSFHYGFFMSNSGIADVAHNTVTLRSNGTGYSHYISGGGLISEKNNSFVTYGSSYARYVTSTYSLSESENNNYFSNGTTLLFLNSAYNTVEDFASQTGLDQNSVSTDPVFTDTLACATCNDTLDGGGMPIAWITDDINGQVRSTQTPDIGAVEYIAAGSFSLGPDSTYCADELLIEAGPAQSVSWNVNGNVSSALTYNLQASNAPTVFNVAVNIVTNGCGPASDNVNITLVPGAELDSNEHICADQNFVINPGGGNTATYTWSNGSITPTITVNEAGTYTVMKSEMGCESSATIVVTQSDEVEIANVEPCEEDAPITIDATINNGIGYAWSGGSSNATAINSFDVSDTYSVTVTDAFGCVSEDTFTVNILADPVAAITYNAPNGFGFFFSSQNSQNLSSATTYNWLIDGTPYTVANPYHAFPFNGGPQSYTVTLEIDNGCDVDLASLDLVIDPLAVTELASGETVSVFPNPATDVLNIQKEGNWENAVLELVDLSGRMIQSVQVLDGTDLITINIDNVASGSYLLNIKQGESVTTMPVIVK